MSMNKPITRKQFLDLGLGAISLVGLAACGGDDSEDEGAGTDDTGADTTASTTNTTTASTTDSTTDSTTASTSATTNSTTDSTTVSTTDDETTNGDETTTDGDDTTTDGGDTTTAGDSTTGAANMCDADPTSMFSDHNHTLMIPLADVIAGAEMMYVAGGNHEHDVTLTAEEFATLRETGQVIVQSSFDNQHMHTVTITCA